MNLDQSHDSDRYGLWVLTSCLRCLVWYRLKDSRSIPDTCQFVQLKFFDTLIAIPVR